MNINNWNGKKKVFVIFLAILLIGGLIGTIFIVQTRLETRIRAEKATVLSFNPSTQTINAEEDLILDINIDPGVNQVNFLKMVIDFDSNIFESTSSTFTLDESSNFNLISDPVITDGQMIITLNIGGNPTDVVRIPQKVGTLVLVTDESKDHSELAGVTQVTFDESQTEIRSVASTDGFSENVLSSTIPAIITIEAVCRPDISTCSWDPVDGAITYHYVVTNEDDGEIIDEGDTPLTSVEFTTEFNVTYSCSVTASNECGNTGEAGEGEGICVPPPELPSPIPSEEPSPILSPSPEPTLPPESSPTPSLTLTPIPTNSPTPTLTLTSTPTPIPSPEPTLPSGVSPTPTPVEIAQVVTQAPIAPAVASPTPSIPPTGSTIAVLGGIFGAVLIVLGGLVLLML